MSDLMENEWERECGRIQLRQLKFRNGEDMEMLVAA